MLRWLRSDRPLPRAFWLLLWCLVGGAAVQWFLAGPLQPVPAGFSPIFWYLLKALDPAGNALLLVLAVVAFALRDRPGWQPLLRFAATRPAALAAGAFVLLCAGAALAYRGWPLSMDEYSAVFQANSFAQGRLAGELPVALLDRLVPPHFQGIFLSVSRATGEAASTYWPGFALLMAPLAFLGVPWMLNPLLAAASLLVLHRLAVRLAGSAEAGGWAVLLALASPAFVVNAISFYAMSAHLLANALFMLLLLEPTRRHALLAGVVGGFALNLHQPLPHLLFALPLLAWLAWRGRLAALALLAVGYALVGLAVGVGWKLYLQALTAGAPALASAPATAQAVAEPAFELLKRAGQLTAQHLTVFGLPSPSTIHARIAALTKLWSWGSAGLVVLAAWGYLIARGRTEARLLVAALLTTFAGYLFVRFDQGHGWGFRYLHSAWFALPLLGAMALAGAPGRAPVAGLQGAAGWCLVLSILFANGFRVFQASDFIDRQLRQVPPLASGEAARAQSVVFVDAGRGFYAHDLVQNHPGLARSPVVMLGRDSGGFMAAHFPGYVRVAEGAWGEFWVRK